MSIIMRRIIMVFVAVTALSMTAIAQKTDISDRDNVIYIENVSTKPGEQVTLSVKMNNTLPVRGFQFDLVLPEGINVAKDEDGFYKVELSTERTTSKKMNYFDSAIQDDGSLRVLCNSSNAYTFDGTTGEVCTIVVAVAEGLGGDFDITLKNVILTDPAASRYPIDGTTSVISVKDCDCGIKGDVNGDGSVSLADIMDIITIILNQ